MRGDSGRLRRWMGVGAVASCAGFSTFETSAVIGAVSVMSATAAPHLQEYLETAHATKAMGDVRVIAISLVRLSADVGRIGAARGEMPVLLVTDGDVPASEEAATKPWGAPVDGRAVQTLASHLVSNEAGYPLDRLGPRWRGPYMDGLSPDPWGSRYAVNVGVSRAGGGRTVFVLSPGPNKVVETPFETIGFGETGDDVIALIGRTP